MTFKINRCLACDTSNKPLSVVFMNDDVRERFLEYSKIKYNGLLDDWLNQIDLAIDKCPVCGHCWYSEQPSRMMLSEMYEARCLTHSLATMSRVPSPVMIAEMNRLYKLVEKPAPRMLDYGSGFGRWARAGVSAGFTVTAYEPSVKRGAEAEEMEFTLIHDLDSLDNQHFDVINLEQVLEHVPDPVEILREVRGYCTPGAIVRIAVPNVLRCPEGDKLWQEWPFDGQRAHTMAPFEHLHGFTPLSLRKTAARAGFVPRNGLSIWRQYPVEMLRSILGQLIPRLGQTLLLAE